MSYNNPITATVNETDGVVGSVSTVRGNVVGSVSQGNQPHVTRVTVPGPKGDQGNAGSASNNVSQAADVDVTSFPLQDGSLLQWRASTQKWTARNELDTTSGNLVLSGGSF